MNSRQIVGYLREDRPVTFIIGAGASRSAGIPTAPKLVAMIREKFHHALEIAGLSESEKSDYGKVMGALSPTQRKDLIQPLLDASRLNWGHLALATIVKTVNVQRILTFNFDFLVERATSMTGQHLPVYDFGVSPSKDISRLAEKAIYHLHGQSYGLRLLNSAEETKAHANALRPLLADSLRNHLTIVIGYSGEADAAFEVIAEEFNSGPNLFWLGHEKEPKAHLKPLLDKDYAHYVGGCDFDRTMLDIAQMLDCFPPTIMKNPPAHVLEALKDMTDFPTTLDSGVDFLTALKDRLQRASDHWEADASSTETAQQAAISGGEGPAGPLPAEMSEAERSARAWIEVTDGNRLGDEAVGLTGPARDEKFVVACERYRAALAIKPDMHEALNNWGSTLYDWAKGLPSPAREEKFAEAAEKYRAALAIKSDKHETLYNWGLTLNDWAEALPSPAREEKFAEAAENYRAALVIKPNLHEALNNCSNTLLRWCHVLTGLAREEKLVEAEETILSAKAITGKADYNLACLNALRGNVAAALDELEACLQDGTLPTVTHLSTDPDMDLLRKETRFKALLAKAG